MSRSGSCLSDAVMVNISWMYAVWFTSRDKHIFTVSEVTTDWHQLLLPQRFMQTASETPIVRVNLEPIHLLTFCNPRYSTLMSHDSKSQFIGAFSECCDLNCSKAGKVAHDAEKSIYQSIRLYDNRAWLQEVFLNKRWNTMGKEWNAIYILYTVNHKKTWHFIFDYNFG